MVICIFFHSRTKGILDVLYMGWGVMFYLKGYLGSEKRNNVPDPNLGKNHILDI